MFSLWLNKKQTQTSPPWGITDSFIYLTPGSRKLPTHARPWLSVAHPFLAQSLGYQLPPPGLGRDPTPILSYTVWNFKCIRAPRIY